MFTKANVTYYMPFKPLSLVLCLVVLLGIKPLNAQHYKLQTSQSDSLANAILNSISPGKVRYTIQSLEEFETRFALDDNRKDIALWIKQEFIDMGYKDVFLDSFLLDSIEWPQGSDIFYTTWQYNVVAKIHGSVDSSKHFVMGAHYDAIVYWGDAFTYTPGADDNASGVAAVLETARVFKEHNIQPDFTIHFVAFAAEELYLHGSTHYAEKMANQQADVVLMINNDMIAYNPIEAQRWRFKMQKYPHTERVRIMAEDIASKYTHLVMFVDSNAIAFSDSYPFYLQGYDAVFFQEYNFNNNLHTVYDVLDSLDVYYCAEVIKISCGLLLYQNMGHLNSVDILSHEAQIQLYPNPAEDHIYVNLKSHTLASEKFIIEIYDMQGRLINYKEHFYDFGNNNLIRLDVNHLKSGVYNCVIKTKQHIYNKSFFKL